MPADTTRWISLPVGATNEFTAGDLLSTGDKSTADLILRGGLALRVNQLTLVRFKAKEDGAGTRLLRGIAAFFSRDRPGRHEVEAGGGTWSSAARNSPSRFATMTPPSSPCSMARSSCAPRTGGHTPSPAGTW
jgi:hypothetical protein